MLEYGTYMQDLQKMTDSSKLILSLILTFLIRLLNHTVSHLSINSWEGNLLLCVIFHPTERRPWTIHSREIQPDMVQSDIIRHILQNEKIFLGNDKNII